jgi:hypothetical protein
MDRKANVRGYGVVTAVMMLILVMGLHLATPTRAYSNGVPDLKDYAGWSAAWWNWAVIEPVATNPLFDATGAFAGKNQTGPVWFLGGSFSSDPVTRNVNIPDGKFIFFPIINSFKNPDNPLPPGPPPPFDPKVIEEYRGIVFDMVNPYGSNMVCTLGGTRVVYNPDTPIVRTQSPVFIMNIPENSLFTDFGALAGDYGPTVSDGYWVMLPPLSAGPHTLHFTASVCPSNPSSFSQDITYNINTPLPGTLILLGSGLLGLMGFGRRRSV